MHEWHTERSTNVLHLINHFLGYSFDTDHSGEQSVEKVKIVERMFTTEEQARTYVTNASYGTNIAYLAPFAAGKVTKACSDALATFKARWKEYTSFKDNLTIAYGRTSEKATCPECHSSINLHYGKNFKKCPVCGSKKIISDSNWKALEAKYRLTQRAAESLASAASKSGVSFVCGIEWHC